MGSTLFDLSAPIDERRNALFPIGLKAHLMKGWHKSHGLNMCPAGLIAVR
jgi:hypothetical protein